MANFRAYPNGPLRNFIDTDRMEDLLPLRIRNYCWAAQVDVLLCTDDEKRPSKNRVTLDAMSGLPAGCRLPAAD
jgi:hypothetical protein